MVKASKSSKPRAPRRRKPAALLAVPEEQAFAEVVEMIQAARGKALAAVNTALVDLYCPAKVSPVVAQMHPEAFGVFKDSYMIEFLNLPREHSEDDLHRGLVRRLKDFLIELGRDFCFVGSEFPVQVGKRDFALDLLFFHRGLNCLCAIELKVDRFEPEYLGKMNFYLEALDRDVRKAHENPAIGVLLCASKDSEVVEYALSRSLSPALVAEYQTQLPDKRLLQAKLHELYALAEMGTE